MTVSYLLRYLFRKKWLIIIPTLIAFFLTWFFTRALEPEYTSEAELSTGYMDSNPFGNTQGGNVNALFNNVILTLQSQHVLDQVSFRLLNNELAGHAPFKTSVDKSDLQAVLAEFSISQRDFVSVLNRKIDSSSVLNLAVQEDRMIREVANLYQYSPLDLMKNVQINRIEGSSFIRIVATSNDPRLSAFVANEICNQFLKLYQSRQGMSSSVSLDALRSIMESQRGALDDKLNLLQSIDNRAVTNPDQFLSTLRTQLVLQQNNLISAQASLKAIDSEIAKAGQSGTGNGLANNEEIIALRNNIDRLYSKYVNEGSSDQNLLMQIDGLRVQLQQKLSATSGSTQKVAIGDLQQQKTDLETKVSVASQTINDLEDKIRSLEGTAKSSAVQQGMIERFQGEVEIARQQYIRANDTYNEALNREKFPGNQFKQILVASPALSADPSMKAKIIGFSVLGIFFGLIFLFLFFEFVDPSIKSPANLAEKVSFPLLANFKQLDKKKAGLFLKPFGVEGNGLLEKIGISEEIKQVRYEVEQSGKRIILVTGYQSGSGKTSVLQALARSLALNNRSVLIVDTNFHNNTLSRLYGNKGRLEEIEVPEKEGNVGGKLIQEHIQYIDNAKVGLIGCGSGDFTPEEILPKNNVLTYLKEHPLNFDYVLIDCAGLDKGPDSKELLNYAEAVLMVFAADQVFMEGDRSFVQFLQERNTHVVGSVLNKVSIYGA